jgi:hypothetical protein
MLTAAASLLIAAVAGFVISGSHVPGVGCIKAPFGGNYCAASGWPSATYDVVRTRPGRA